VAPLPPAQQLTGGSTGVEPVSCTSVPPRSSTNSKKQPGLQPVNHRVLASLNPSKWKWNSGVQMSWRCVVA
jgi:hypothetical protein